MTDKTEHILMITIGSIVIVGLMYITMVFIPTSSKLEYEQIKKISDSRRRILYNAWAKEYGNPKHLTQDEFFMLKVDYDFWGNRTIKEIK